MIRYWFERHKGEGDYIANWGYDRLLLLKEAVGEKARQGFKEELIKMSAVHSSKQPSYDHYWCRKASGAI